MAAAGTPTTAGLGRAVCARGDFAASLGLGKQTDKLRNKGNY